MTAKTFTPNTAAGAYRQADLEKMDDSALARVRDMALEEFNSPLGCADEEYFEILAGAADEILMSRAGWFRA